MKSIMISIRPKWCELIANGKKTIEVRKTRPKIETPFKVYIYETRAKSDRPIMLDFGALDFHGRGQVIGEFVCDTVEEFNYGVQEPEDATSLYDCYMGYSADLYEANDTCLTKQEIDDYGNKKFLYSWHISDLVIYDNPKELGEFHSYCSGAGNADNKKCKNCSHLCFDNDPISGYSRWCDVHRRKPLTRPPVSWCYVEKIFKKEGKEA